jgi:hypothetical protein
MNKEKCVLWERAKNLANDRGLQMSPVCPMEEICNGKRCFYINPVEKVEQELQKHNEEVIIGC